MVRILQVIDAVDRGGTETLLYDVCANSKKYGLDTVLVTSKGGELLDGFRSAGIDSVVIPRRWKFDIGFVRKLRRLVQARHIDIVHTHFAVDAFHAYVATQGLRIVRVLSFHGYPYSPQERIALRFLVPRMGKNIAVSHTFLRLLRKREGYSESSPFTVIYNGVDSRRLAPGVTNLRKELSLAPTTLLFGMVGNFGRWKDQATICRGLPLVFSELPDSRFVFVGDNIGKNGREITRCKEICSGEGIGDRVHFLGRRSDVGGILQNLDCAVLSSLEDTFGIALVEAWMTGVPTLISDIPPFMEISVQGKYANVFRVADPEDFALHLLNIAAHLEDERIKSIRTKKWAVEQFGIRVHMEKLRETYQSLMLS